MYRWILDLVSGRWRRLLVVVLALGQQGLVEEVRFRLVSSWSSVV
jgi:hypothetical protein